MYYDIINNIIIPTDNPNLNRPLITNFNSKILTCYLLAYQSYMKRTRVIIILGPTSSGKSDLAVKLAKKLEKEIEKQSEIISVDSRQIYKDMNLGTGKVEGEWKEVKNFRSLASEKFASEKSKKFFVYKDISHHLIDFVDPTTHSQEDKKYSVTNFQKDCLKLIKEISARGNIPILCGGTGFWISAVVDNTIFPEVKPNEKLRKSLEKKSADELFKKLRKKDPDRTKNIDPKNKFRLIRALEICEELGAVPTTKQKPPKDIDFLQIGLDWPKDKLAKKIKKRLESRWTDGMIEEVKNLKEKYKMSWEEIQSFGLAYYWIPLYLQNKLTDDQKNIITNPIQAKEELIKRVYFAEKNYAKRQRTWFKRDKRIIWENDFKKIFSLVKDFLTQDA